MCIHLTFRDTNTLDVVLAQHECPTGNKSLRARPIISSGIILALFCYSDVKIKMDTMQHRQCTIVEQRDLKKMHQILYKIHLL